MHPVAHVRLARLDAFADDLGSDWLSADETHRLQAMTAPARRRSFLAGHAASLPTGCSWMPHGSRWIGIRMDGRCCWWMTRRRRCRSR